MREGRIFRLWYCCGGLDSLLARVPENLSIFGQKGGVVANLHCFPIPNNIQFDELQFCILFSFSDAIY